VLTMLALVTLVLKSLVEWQQRRAAPSVPEDEITPPRSHA
jgi:ABC-type sulfate transport system permease subunit